MTITAKTERTDQGEHSCYPVQSATGSIFDPELPALTPERPRPRPEGTVTSIYWEKSSACTPFSSARISAL